MNKRGEANSMTWIGVGILVLAGLMAYQSGALPFLGSAKGGAVGGGGAGQTINVNVSGQCTTDSTALTIGPMQDYYTNAGLSNLYTRWYIQTANGPWVDQGYVADSTVKTVAPGQKVAVYYNLNGSATSYYPRVNVFTVPCSGAFVSSAAKDDDSFRLGNMTRAADLTITVINSDGTTKNTAGAPQKLLAGNVRKMNFEIDYPNHETFGSPFARGAEGVGTQGSDVGGKVLMECFYNASMYSQLDLASGKARYGGQFPLHTPLTAALGTAVTGWEFDGAKSNDVVKDQLILTADPSNPASTTVENVNCTFVDGAWYLPTQTTIPAFGYENDKQGDVGANDFSQVFNVNGTG